jgi:hypothetical protein
MALTREIAIVKSELEVETKRLFDVLEQIGNEAQIQADLTAACANISLNELTQSVRKAIEYEGRVHILCVLLNRLLEDERG